LSRGASLVVQPAHFFIQMSGLLDLFLRQQYLRWIGQLTAGLEYSQSEPRVLCPPRSEISDVGLSSAIFAAMSIAFVGWRSPFNRKVRFFGEKLRERQGATPVVPGGIG